MTGYDDIVRIRGGHLHKRVSVFNPMGRFYAQCSKHPDFYREINFSQDPFSAEKIVADAFISDAQKIVDLCSFCFEENKPVVKPACAQEEHDACGCEQ